MSHRYVVIAEREECSLIPPDERDRTLIVTGAGGANVIRALRGLPKESDILNVGYCGSMWHCVGERVEINNVRLYHPECNVKEMTHRLQQDGCLCLTAGDFVKEDKSGLKCVYDMELAYIAAFGFAKIRSIKTVSDNLNYINYKKFTIANV